MIFAYCISWQALSDDGKIGALVALFTLVAVVVALSLGITSFIQTKNLFKKQRRSNLLNEIKRWAVDIHNFFAPETFEELRDIFDRHLSRLYEKDIDSEQCEKLYKEEMSNLKRLQETRDELTLLSLEASSQYMRRISKKLNDGLFKYVDILAVHLNAHRRLINRQDKDKTGKGSDRVGAHIKFLRKFANDVLIEVGELLGRDVS